MPSEVFLDTVFAIALASPKDRYHLRALEIANKLESNRTRMITTKAILLEIGNALAKRNHRTAAVQLLKALSSDPQVEVVPLSETLYTSGFGLFRERLDKDWGLTDCISFVVMQDREVTDALTTDQHFIQAGFKALLRDPNM